MPQTLIDIYLDWVNNYLTISKWAEHNGMTTKEATKFLDALGTAYNRYSDLTNTK